MLAPDMKQVTNDFLYNWSTFSMFFSEPVSLELGGQQLELEGKPGGFSWTLFQRSFTCTFCNRCCLGDHVRIRTWFPQEPAPPQAIEVPCTLNGVPFPLRIYTSEQDTTIHGCDFLSFQNERHPQTGTQIAFCSLWEKGQTPLNCQAFPGLLPQKVNSRFWGPTRVLTRRLPGRNWAKPQCPVDIYSPPDERRIAADRALLSGWRKALSPIPGCFIEPAYELWESLIERTLKGDPPKENVFFDNYEWSG